MRPCVHSSPRAPFFAAVTTTNYNDVGGARASTTPTATRAASTATRAAGACPPFRPIGDFVRHAGSAAAGIVPAGQLDCVGRLPASARQQRKAARGGRAPSPAQRARTADALRRSHASGRGSARRARRLQHRADGDPLCAHAAVILYYACMYMWYIRMMIQICQ